MNQNNEPIDLATDISVEPVNIVNVSAVSPAMDLVTRWKSTNGLIVNIPASTEAQPVAKRLNMKIGRFMLRLYGPGGGGRGWRGLREWHSPTNVPETDEDRETMRLIKEQALVLSGKKAPPMFTRADTQPYLGGARRAQSMKVTVGVIPAAGWTREMLQQWRFLNNIDALPGENLQTVDGLAAAISSSATIANELVKHRHLRAPNVLAGKQTAAEGAARRITASAE